MPKMTTAAKTKTAEQPLQEIVVRVMTIAELLTQLRESDSTELENDDAQNHAVPATEHQKTRECAADV